jgi:hypothetical protein
MIRAWRAKLQRSMWPPAVVMGAVPREGVSQVSFAEDQNAVGEFGSGCADEPFGEAVRSRTSRWDLHGFDPGAGQDSVERGGELAGAIADEEPEAGGRARRGPSAGCGPAGWSRLQSDGWSSEDVHVAAADFEGEEHVDPFQGDGAVDVEEVHGQHGRGLRAQETSP